MNILAAIYIEQIEVVIGFIGSLSCSVLNAILPGIFFIIVSKKNRKLKATQIELLLASLLSIYGLVMSVLSTTM